MILADGLTKDQADPADLLRAALSSGSYQLHDEAAAGAEKAAKSHPRAEEAAVTESAKFNSDAKNQSLHHRKRGNLNE